MRVIAALFSILMPGFGQIYNKHFIKGVIFVVMEHVNNIFGKINQAIQLDFNGFHQQALDIVVYDFTLFYPGLYVYTVWDAWFYAKEGANKTTTAIPFVIAGFLGLLSTIFFSKLPFPTLFTGFSMIIPMVVGMIIFREQ